jgi:hypothetical protein
MRATGRGLVYSGKPDELAHRQRLRVNDHSPVWFMRNRRRCLNRFAFKKTCPFEFTRHVQPKADNPIDLPFCRAD